MKEKTIAIAMLLASSAAAQGFSGTVSVGATSAASSLCNILASVKYLLFFIAGAIGVVVIVLQGIKWIGSAEDPGARKSAKMGVIHAVIGLIIVSLAVAIVQMVFVGQVCTLT